jgi:hypothetical protein
MWLSALEKINSLISILSPLKGINDRELPPLTEEPLTTPGLSIYRGLRGHGDLVWWFLVLLVLILLVVLWHRHPTD